MTVAPRQLRRSARLWALGLLAWLVLNGLPVMPTGHAMAMGSMGHASHAVAMAQAGMADHPEGDACCGSHGQVSCHCPAPCVAAALPSVVAWTVVTRWPSAGPYPAATGRAPHRDDGPPLRPPLV